MILLCDVGQVEARFGPFGDSVNINAREVHFLCVKRAIGLEIILGAPNGTPR
jgi:hypothetical protein